MSNSYVDEPSKCLTLPSSSLSFGVLTLVVLTGYIFIYILLYFSLTKSFRSYYDPGLDSASDRNEYQKYRLRGKGGRCVVLTTLPHSCADVLKSGSLNLQEPSGPVQACNGTALTLPIPYILARSSVGIATDYGLYGLGSNPGGDEIFHPSRPALGPTQPLVQRVLGLYRGQRATGACCCPLTPF